MSLQQTLGSTQRLLVSLERRGGVVLQDGLSPPQVAVIEEAMGVAFPEDLRSLLSWRVPAGPEWPDWTRVARSGKVHDELERALAWPLEGMLFDIEHSAFWDPQWGERPTSNADAFAIARDRFALAPKLIPIYGHRYLPSEPCQAGNPVFSVHQMDIIIYGSDLWWYFATDHGNWPLFQDGAREIRCWSHWMKLGR